MTRRLACLGTLLLVAAPAAAQVPADKALATMKPGDGFQVELFAHEPHLINPTSIDIDHKGRVWVAEAVNYRRVNFGRPLLRPEGDRIVVLTDKDGDGKADESVVFYQGKDIIAPLGVCVVPLANGTGFRVYVAQSPDILVFEDRDGDLKADGPPKKLLTGFQGFDHDHGVHGLSIGPDGKLYFTVGDAGVKNLQASDGKGPKWTSNGTDCRAGTVWRCDQDGTNLELIAHNFRNNYECCVNSFGEVWLSDNDDDGNQQTRICFVMPGGNYGYHPRGKGESHWHEEQPGVVHKVLRTGFGSPTGITFYEGSLLPEKYRGHLLHCDAGPREVRSFHIKPKGAGYELDKEVILTSSDNWFRPSAVRVGPDGSVFVADWYDPGVGGHGMGDWTRGRIYRLTPKGHKGYTVPPVKLDTKEGLLAALTNPNNTTRVMALTAIRTGDDRWFGDVYFPLLKNKVMTPLKARAIFALIQQTMRNETALPAFKKYLDMAAIGEGVVMVRAFSSAMNGRTGFPWVKEFQPPNDEARLGAIADYKNAIEFGGPEFVRELLLLMRNAKPDAALIDVFYAAAKKYDGKDHFYRAALNIACGTDPKRRDAILADFDKHFPEWNDTVADLVWELRPKSVLPRLGKLLADARLTGPQKARVLDILAASDDPAAGQTVLAALLSDAPAEVKARAIDHLRLFLPTKWKELRGGEGLAAAVKQLLADPRTQLTGLQLVAAAGDERRVAEVAKLAGGTGAADVRREAVRTLGKLRSAAAVTALAGLVGAGGDLTPQAIAALGELATGQAKDPAVQPALAALQSVVTGGADPATKRAAVEALAGTRGGTAWLLDAHAKKRFPADLVPLAGQLLRNSPFQGERNKAMLLFPAPGKIDPKKLPAIAELAKRAGNADRGQKVWAASQAGAAQCAKCHTVRGVGGQVGPDLSMIGKKGSKENLFESLITPSKAIADQYVQQSITTAAGVTVSGLVVGENGNAITLRDANGKDTVIQATDVESRRKLQLSIMPEDIVAALTEEELVDLVAYLQTLQTAALTPDSFRVAGPFPAANMAAALKTEFGPEKGPFDPALKIRAGDKMLPWGSIRPDATGYFDLAGLHGAAGNNSASYLYAEFESPSDQDAEVLLGTDDGAKLWVNGAAVFTHSRTVAATPGRDAVKVKLKAGKNAVLLKVANGNNPHGFYFTLLSKDETKVVPVK